MIHSSSNERSELWLKIESMKKVDNIHYHFLFCCNCMRNVFTKQVDICCMISEFFFVFWKHHEHTQLFILIYKINAITLNASVRYIHWVKNLKSKKITSLQYLLCSWKYQCLVRFMTILSFLTSRADRSLEIKNLITRNHSKSKTSSLKNYNQKLKTIN